MRRIVSRTGLALALAVLGGGGGALAQQTPLSLSSAPTGRETEIDVIGSILYDSNIARSDTKLAAERGLSLDDEVATPEMDFTIARQIGQDIFFLQGSASYLFHVHDTILDRENINVTTGVNARFLRCQELPTAAYSRVQADLADETLGIVTNVVQVTTVGVSVDCGRSIGLAPQASITQTWRDNSAAIYAANNSNTLTTSAGLGYRQPVLGTFSLFGNYSTTGFSTHAVMHPLVGPAANFGLIYYGGGISYDRHLGGRIQGAASLSYTELDPTSPLLKTFRGLTYSLDGIYNLNTRISLHVLTSRATTPSNRIDANYSVNDTYEGDLSYMMSNRVTVTLTETYKDQSYSVYSAAPMQDLSQQTINDLLAAVTYKLSRRFSFTLNAGDEERRANFQGLNYSSLRVGVSAMATY